MSTTYPGPTLDQSPEQASSQLDTTQAERRRWHRRIAAAIAALALIAL